MSGRDALAFMAGLGGGYMNQQEVERRQKLEQADIDWKTNLRNRDQAEYDRSISMRNQLADAAQPVAPTTELQHDAAADDRDVGQPGTTMAPVGQRVGNQVYADPAAARAAAVAANTPDAQSARMADVMNRFGDVKGARDMRAGLKQEKLADIQLNDAQRKDLQERTWEDLRSSATTPQGVADWISSSQGDGHGGKLKATAVVNKDGSFTINRLNDDGTTGPQLGSKYSSVSDAHDDIAAHMSPTMMLQHHYQQSQLAISKQNADTQEQYRRDQARNTADRVAMQGEIAAMRLESAKGAAAAKNDPSRYLPPAATIQLKGIEKRTEALQNAIDKAKVEGSFDPTKNPQHKEMVTDLAALTQQQEDLYGRYIPGYRQAGPGMDPISAIDRRNGAPAAPAAVPGHAPMAPVAAPAGPATPAAPAGRMAPTDFVAAAINGSSGHPDQAMVAGVQRAAQAGEVLSVAQQDLRAAGKSGSPHAIQAAAARVQAADQAYREAMSAGGLPPDLRQRMAAQYGGV